MADAGHHAICLVRRSDGEARQLRPDEFDQIDALRADPDTAVWLAVRNPNADDLRLIQNEFAIHPLAMEDVRKRRQRPKLDSYVDQHMLVLYEAAEGKGRPREIDAERPSGRLAELHLFGGPRWLVSVQWADSPAIMGARAHFERTDDPLGATIGGVVYAIFDAAADSYFPVLDRMAERMDALEDRILSGNGGSEGLRDMLAIKRELLELRRVLAPMRDIANSLLRRDIPLIDDAMVPYFQDLFDHLVRLLDQLDLYRDLLASILDARLTVTSNALNAIMKRLTAITVILMAPTLIAGIYGMNFVRMPELSWPLGYPFALGLMAAAMVGAYFFFRSRDWF